MKMLGRNFHVPGNMMPDDLGGQLRLHQRKIEPDPGIDENVFHALLAPQPAQKADQRLLVGDIVRTVVREHAA